RPSHRRTKKATARQRRGESAMRMITSTTARYRPIALAALLASAAASAQHGAADGEWRAYSGDAGSTKYSPLEQIDASNVSQLEIAWRRPAVDASILEQVPDLRYGASFRSTPLMIDGVLYAPNGIGFVEAFD